MTCKAVDEVITNSQQILEEVKQALDSNSQKYKAQADKRRREKIFEIGDLVMVFLRKERLSNHGHNKLSQRKYGPFPILRRLHGNAYEVGLPEDMLIHNVFNVMDIYEYYPPDDMQTQQTSRGTGNELGTSSSKEGVSDAGNKISAQENTDYNPLQLDSLTAKDRATAQLPAIPAHTFIKTQPQVPARAKGISSEDKIRKKKNSKERRERIEELR